MCFYLQSVIPILVNCSGQLTKYCYAVKAKCPGLWGATCPVLTVLTSAHSKHANHMTMTTSGQIMPWSDCLNTKGNMNIKTCVRL